MSLIENLLRLGRRQCEELRRTLAELELLAQRLRADAGRLQAAIERSVAAGDPGSARSLNERRGKVERSLAGVASRIAEAGDALAAAERELKRHERAAAQRADSVGPSERRSTRRSRRAPPAAPAQ